MSTATRRLSGPPGTRPSSRHRELAARRAVRALGAAADRHCGRLCAVSLIEVVRQSSWTTAATAPAYPCGNRCIGPNSFGGQSSARSSCQRRNRRLHRNRHVPGPCAGIVPFPGAHSISRLVDIVLGLPSFLIALSFTFLTAVPECSTRCCCT